VTCPQARISYNRIASSTGTTAVVTCPQARISYNVLKARRERDELIVCIQTDPDEYWVPETDYEIVSP